MQGDAAGNIAPRNFILTGRGSFYFDLCCDWYSLVSRITWKHPQQAVPTQTPEQ